MPNFLARVAASTLGGTASADLPAAAPAPGGSWIAHPPATAADEGSPTAPAVRTASGGQTSDIAPPDVAGPDVAGPDVAGPGLAAPRLAASPIGPVRAGRPETTTRRAPTSPGPASEPAGATSPAAPSVPAATATSTVPGARSSDSRPGHVESIATDRSATHAPAPGPTASEAHETERAPLPVLVDPARRHLVRVPRSLRGGSWRTGPDEVSGTSPDDGSLRALAALLATPIAHDDQIEEGDAQPLPVPSGGITVGSDAASMGRIGTTVELPVRPEPDTAGSRGGRVDPAGWHLSVGRVEVQVDNRASPPVPPRSEPVAVAADPLEQRFVDRFRLRL